MNNQTFENKIAREVAQREADENKTRTEIANKGRNERREFMLKMALWEKEHNQFFHIGGMGYDPDPVYGLIDGTYRLLMYVKPCCYGYEIEAHNKFRHNARAAVRRVTRR